jgi:riboflavin kinase/FMN adenylyltransferase
MRYITAAIGNFDGIHIGHDQIIKTCIDIGNRFGQDKKIVTFEYEFDKFTNSAKKYKKIYGKHGKISTFNNYDIDDIIFYSLDSQTAIMSPERFISEILIDKLRIRNIVVGFNFRFGHKAKGDIYFLQELSSKYNYGVEVINAVKQEGMVISSSMIREMLAEGRIIEANRLLTESYRIDFRDHRYEIVSDKELLILDTDFVYPMDGTYLVIENQREIEINVNNKEGSLCLTSNELLTPDIIQFIKKI